ncbi:translation initiation factor IF-2B subunit alpha [Thermococcus sp. MV5]|uniref:translation initiation factor IF-2B subunit alpha n=1 Tax=Thermococcus sp. MV5 TaxID=1638272 RepID=UPI00143BFCC7|nr:translation initiation factor IF-2B subunit alpha [Thermococcus sp. MV5]NJE25300.1 translation initiation factor IF-2B subunit alpha [Thermococcus sp. MV5]
MLPKEVEEIIRRMEEERIQGASYLAEMGAKAYIKLTEIFEGDTLLEGIKELGTELINVNPTMASLYNLVRFIPLTKNPEFVKAKAEEFIRLNKEAKLEIGNIGSEIIDQNEIIITHSYSSAVLEIIKRAKEKGKTFKVILTESGPDYEGLALAKRLDELKIPFEVITDSQMGLFTKKATLALVGADNITRDGYVFNKAGTYLLALSCHDNSIPFYVAAESFKIHPEAKVDDVKIVERKFKRDHIIIRNYLFDATPWKYIRGIITELGVLVPPKEI